MTINTNPAPLYEQDGTPSPLGAPEMHQGLTYAAHMADLEALDEAEVGPSIEPRYYKFTQAGERLRGIFCGLANVPKNEDGQEKFMTAVVIQTKDGVFINAGSSLVPQFDHIQNGTPVEVEFVGQVKTNRGRNVNKFEVRMLNARVAVNGKALPPPAPSSMVDMAKDLGGKPAVRKSAPDPVDGRDYITEFWTSVREVGLDREEAKNLLREAGGSFKRAAEALRPPEIDENPFA